MRRRHGTSISQKLNHILYVLASILAVALVGCIAFEVQVKGWRPGADKQQNTLTAAASPAAEDTGSSEDAAEETSTEKWQEGTISYNGYYYRYNNYLKTYLFMGIDTDDEVYNMITKDTGYQSDALFLVVADTREKTMSVITINRNTMAVIEAFTRSGESLGYELSQICLQHAYGDGRKLSCSRVVDAVEELFYGIPIQGYVSMNMGAIPSMNDSIGGVTVTVLDDLDYESRGVNLKQGDVVTLSGQEAYCYLRGRDVDDFDSATERLRRQEQYISSFIQTVQEMDSPQLALVNLYEAVEPYTVTNIDFSSLLDELVEYSYTDNDIYTVPGETVYGMGGFEEYYVDDEAFYDLVIRVFYNQVE